jgi:hypothetical protein
MLNNRTLTFMSSCFHLRQVNFLSQGNSDAIASTVFQFVHKLRGCRSSSRVNPASPFFQRNRLRSSSFGSIVGNVTDATGAGVAGATVKIRLLSATTWKMD